MDKYDELERKDLTTHESDIKDELQSYNILKNEKYERLGTLRNLLDKKRRVHLAVSLGRTDIMTH
jgi:hypothetical protein